MKYILDFDRVLFDVGSYKKILDSRGIRDLEFEPSVWDTLTVRDFLYDDVIPFLSSIARNDLIIISAMTPRYGPHVREYQKRKLIDVHLEEYVSEVVVMEGDKAPYVCKYADTFPAVFVDDKLSHLESSLKSCPSIQCVQMIRPNISPEDELVSSREDIPTIEGLVELNAIMEKL